MVIRTMLHERIQEGFEELEKMEVGSDEYKQTVDELTKLIDRAIEMEKVDLEATENTESREADNELKRKQLISECIDMIVKNGLTAISVIGGFILTVWGTNKCLKFEETGTVTTIPGRGFINKLFFWK